MLEIAILLSFLIICFIVFSRKKQQSLPKAKQFNNRQHTISRSPSTDQSVEVEVITTEQIMDRQQYAACTRADIPCEVKESKPGSSTSTSWTYELPARWFRKDEQISIAGFNINTGMLYVGRGLSSVVGLGGLEPALIDPSLTIDLQNPDFAGLTIPYWPSYSAVSPAARCAYLHWLADGRRDANANIGYVFLFFYGLERRALNDAPLQSKAQAELPEIAVEVERLLTIYGGNPSFHNYAAAFLALLQLISCPCRSYDFKPPLSITPTGEFPLSIRMALGQLALDEKPIPDDWAYVWYRSAPMSRLRTPIQRCPDEFFELFKFRYHARYGAGLRIKPNKTKIRINYQPASSSFGGEVRLGGNLAQHLLEVPDITALQSPLGGITEIAEACTTDLEPYSRWIGRNPNLKGSPTGIALLPPDLAARHSSEQMESLTGFIEGCLDGMSMGEIDLGDLLAHWERTPTGKTPRGQAVLLLQLLERRGYGLEPDHRFGGPVPSVGRKGIIFRLLPDSPSSPSTVYAGATAMMQLALCVAGADEQVAWEEIVTLENFLAEVLPVSPQEAVRLEAHLRWLLVDPPQWNSIKQRIEALEPEQRAAIGQFLVTMATADGQVTPSEISSLTKLYRLLGLDPAQVYGQIHAAQATSMQPATMPICVQPASAATQGYSLPKSQVSVSRTPAVVLDMNRIEAKLRQTAAVSALLSTIFVDEQETALDATRPTTTPADSPLGLHLEQSLFLRALLDRPSWSRLDAEGLASSHRVMLDGTVDAINELTIERAGDLLLEGDDPIEINQAVRKELAV